jgi:hypothetical protein
MNRILSQWLFGAVDDTARAAMILSLAGAAMSLGEGENGKAIHGHRVRSRSTVRGRGAAWRGSRATEGEMHGYPLRSWAVIEETSEAEPVRLSI